MNTLRNRENLLLQAQGQMVILATVLFSFIPLSQDIAENYQYTAWVQLLLGTTAGTQKQTW